MTPSELRELDVKWLHEEGLFSKYLRKIHPNFDLLNKIASYPKYSIGYDIALRRSEFSNLYRMDTRWSLFFNDKLKKQKYIPRTSYNREVYLFQNLKKSDFAERFGK